MKLVEKLGLKALHQLDPEQAHSLSIKALQNGLVPLAGPVTSARLATKVAGLALPNPVGLAAGYDKNAEVITPLSRAGFGFVEVGAATPRAQDGNPKPRLFRLSEDRAVINRFGFKPIHICPGRRRNESPKQHTALGAITTSVSGFIMAPACVSKYALKLHP